MAKRAKAETVEVKSSHVAYMSRPRKQLSSSKRLRRLRTDQDSCLREYTMKDHITVQGQDGKFAAYIARTETVPAPAVVVLQELFGVNADIRRALR